VNIKVLSPMMRALPLVLILTACLLSACGGSRMDMAAMTAAQPVDLQITNISSAPQPEYTIGVGDKLSVRVFQVPDLSFDQLVVDTSGDIQMPLIGAVRATGQTAGQLSTQIAERLSAQYLRNPQVTVTVTEAASQKITVDGAVTKPGVYEMRGSTSLLQAVAMAEGPTAVADLTQVAVFRTISGQRSVALFDLQAIRQGRAEDPAVLGDDVVVVDTSRTSAAMRGIISAIPALAIFRPY
jgi:polysaccharide export outer membrane protein